MYNYDETSENVKRNEPRKRTDVKLKLCGSHITLSEYHENTVPYDYQRKKLKLTEEGKVELKELGRKSDASEEQQIVNARRVQQRRNTRIRDLMNCNEDDLAVFETLTTTYQDIDKFNHARKEYHRKTERFVQTGKLYGKVVKNFTPDSEFTLKLFGVIEFQDGHRWRQKGIDHPGSGNVHGHHFQNTPYLPRVHVIHANVRDIDVKLSEHYLNYSESVGFYWSKIADRNTIWFNTQRECLLYLRDHKKDLPGFYFNAELKELCVNALLWEQGHTQIKKLKDLRKKGKLSNPGEYLCQYVAEDVSDSRLRNRRAWYKKGKLVQPAEYRDPAKVNAIIWQLDLWAYFIYQIDFIAEYLGAMTYYFFNLWIMVYPWIKTYYERKRNKEKMTQADWIVAGVIEEYQPLLL